jgi:hypothetical protein
MSFFRRSRSPQDRFPPQRLSALPMLIGASVKMHIKGSGADDANIWNTKFLAGYVLGFPDYLDNIDERFGGQIRQMLFDAIHGPETGKELFSRSLALLLQEDQQVKKGWGTGAADGERYFRALDNGSDAHDATMSLKSMFEVGAVDMRQLAL